MNLFLTVLNIRVFLQSADKLAAEVAQAVFDLAGGVGDRPELPA